MKYLDADKDLEKGGRDLQTVGMSFEQLAVDHRRRKGTCRLESRHGRECAKLTTTMSTGVTRGYVSGESRRKTTLKINNDNNNNDNKHRRREGTCKEDNNKRRPRASNGQ